MLLAMRNMVLFPGVVLPVSVGRKSSLKVCNKAEKEDALIVAATQIDPKCDVPTSKDLYKTATVAKILRSFEMPNGTRTVILQGMCRVNINTVTFSNGVITAGIEQLEEKPFPAKSKEENLLIEAFRTAAEKLIKMGNMGVPDEAIFAIKNIKSASLLVNFVAMNFPFSVRKKINLLKLDSTKDRCFALTKMMNDELQMGEWMMEIQQRTKSDLDTQQREYFLHQQIKNIQSELGEDQAGDINDLRQKAASKKWNSQVAETFEKEVKKLERLNTQSPDYNVQLNYLQTMLNLPWGNCTEDNLNLNNAERVLNKDHYGLEKVKERILEHLAVLRLRGGNASPIICLYGPPGVGKTSLGKSIASALKRKYVRMSLGGLHDESEVRGHRRTYIGAMPGRIIKGMIKAESDNPVFILDEIDKITQNTVNGDPSSALLEVLDPAQNNAFHDNYIDIDYDLSKVMFIATANNIGSIPRPLLDRMELIEVSGYITEEKIEIAKRHLIPKEKENNGLGDHAEIKLSKPAIEYLIENYTRESGVRGLEKQINKLFRKMALDYARNSTFPCTDIKPANITTLLGTPPYSRDKYQGNGYAGVVTGLAWTSVGGEILFIETSISRGKGGKLTLTGNLGDVMKESAVLALEYIKAHAQKLDIDYRVFDNWNIHVHVPEGAVPKDGPSAGITMATSIASALTQRLVRKNLAMTGEITLRGKVLPVGGIKEKILAAKRAGITDIIMCSENRKNIEEIPAMYLKGLTFHYVDDVMQVLDIALLDEKVKDAIDTTVEEETEKK